jgi:hypothetical protein
MSFLFMEACGWVPEGKTTGLQGPILIYPFKEHEAHEG